MDYTPQFEEVWERYPKRVGKAEAWTVWQSLSPAPELAAQIVAAVETHAQTEQWARSLAEDGGRFIPKLAKFLARRQWEDDPPPTPEPQRGDPDWLPNEDDDEVEAILAKAGAIPPAGEVP